MSIQLIQQYYSKVEKIIQYSGSRNESSLRKPFQDLLEAFAASKNLLLVTEVEVRTRGGRRVIPDGTLKDALRQNWGYWESKDEKDDLNAEIATKLAKGYPSNNILFEDTHNAVLYQNGTEFARSEIANAPALDALLTQFVAYEPPEVTEFHRAIQQFNADVPALANELREIIGEQYAVNATFHLALDEFLELSKKNINPRVVMADAREMIIQHVLTEDIFMTVFDEPQFHRENAIARKLQEVVETFYHGVTQRSIHARIGPYYERINARAAQIYDHHEKQKFLKALYENFYRTYNPKAADRLGIIYTPDEIVRFMIYAVDYLTFKHFGKTLGDRNVEILDPSVGTGTYVTELIEYLPLAQLPEKYRDEIHCNEVAILPYYIANLNIEYTYKQKVGEYVPFENICFVDTLDNTGFAKSGKHQMDFLGLVDENTERIERQNDRKISVILGNPPYNDNQRNENENNKNREYPDIDKRIRETYIKKSSAQKTHLYDMYTRFIRWASDRLDRNGVIAFVSNNSFLDSRAYDGFRQVLSEDFNHIYLIDLKGNARTSGERRKREGGNVFSDQIRVGVSVYFLLRKEGEQGCHILYNAVPDYTRAEEKKTYLRDNRFADLPFELVHPDKNHNWINQSTTEWEELVPIVSKAAKQSLSLQTPVMFQYYSGGAKSNRDDWVIDFSETRLAQKSQFLAKFFNAYQNKGEDFDTTIKWSRDLKLKFHRGAHDSFKPSRIRPLLYRPYCKHFIYNSDVFIDVPGVANDMLADNVCICINVGPRVFNVLATDAIPDYHLNGDSQCLPLYRYAANGEPVENITDRALEQFRQHYQEQRITKQDIFHYIYAVLHHPSYREKFALNLKREFPRIPLYEDFRQWGNWGKQLMDLHLNYERVKSYRLKREDRKLKDLRQPVSPRLIARKETGIIEVDTLTTLRGVPPEAWEYRLGTYTALEWVLERYKERKPKDPTIREEFDTYRFADYKEYVIDLLRRVCTVSVETMKIIHQMPK